MIAFQALYEQGKLIFLEEEPSHLGPIQVLVVFPGDQEHLETDEDPFCDLPWTDFER